MTQRYAETKATIGGVENLKTAKKYYCQSARMSGFNSNRALLGLVVVCEQLQTMKGVSATEKTELKELVEWANAKLQIKYDKAREEGIVQNIKTARWYNSERLGKFPRLGP